MDSGIVDGNNVNVTFIVCAYSGLLNVSEYQTITENEERIANEIRPADSM